MRITAAKCGFEREPLVRPLGFKGAHLRELWQVAVMLREDSGRSAVGLGVQSPLWSDSRVFVGLGEAASNEAMLAMTRFAAGRAVSVDWQGPGELFDALLPEVLAHGRAVTGAADLSPTFALNSLVPVDNAAWLLYAAAKGAKRFEEMIPEDARKALSSRHLRLLSVPMASFHVPVNELAEWVRDGLSLLKIKIGSDPDGSGDPEQMLRWDARRLEEIHRAVADIQCPAGRRAMYYLDANGRYDSKDLLKRLLDSLQRIGALGRIVLLEEPFAPNSRLDVSDIPVRLAIDESYHDAADVRRLTAMGYRCVALKPAAKTLTVSLRAARAAYDADVPCFCADLTVNPALLEWNRNVAARLPPLPGLTEGILESNGPQNYRDWDRLTSHHPMPHARWARIHDGCYELDEEFYATSGGLFEQSDYYRQLAESQKDDVTRDP